MKIALVGNPNSGKTTLFNYLTGMNAKIGNWPGVTIEKKTGTIKGTKHEITDLPGIYSLSPYSAEEEISRKYIFEEKPDIIINIVDATSLERSLYLTTQLMELECKTIIALNMADLLEKKGIKIDIKKLEEKLGVKVLKISALKGIGINELIKEIDTKNDSFSAKIFDNKLENSIQKISNISHLNHKRFVAIKLLEKDFRFLSNTSNEIISIRNELENSYDTDLEEVIATERYAFIEKVKNVCVQEKLIIETFADRLDKIFLNKWLAIPIFVIIIFFVYYLSVGVIGASAGRSLSNNVYKIGEIASEFFININASEWVKSLVIDGIIAGVGAVVCESRHGNLHQGA